MSVPRLEDIAFFASIKWKHTQLLPQIVERAYTELKKGKGSNAPVYVYRRIQGISGRIIEKMMQYTCLPLRFRARWVVAFQNILTQVYMWGLDLAKNLDTPYKLRGLDLAKNLDTSYKLTYVRYCMKRIVQDQVGQIDKPKTILKILEDSMFVMHFNYSFMAKHLTGDKELKSIAKRVLKEMNEEGGKKMRKQLLDEDIRMKQPNIDYLVSCYNREIQRRHGFCVIKELWELAKVSDLAYVHFYVEQQRRLNPDSLQEQLLQATMFSLQPGGFWSLRVDVLMYLHDNMEPDTWLRVLEKHFVKVFLVVMQHSWRHRPLCVSWFTSVQHTLDTSSFHKMFLFLTLRWECGEYDFYDIMPILQNIWLKSPVHLKTDDAFIIRIIPRMFCVNYDVDVLAFFLNSYGPELQRNLLAQIVSCLFEKKKEYLIPKCLETIRKVETEMKQELLNDKNFTIRYLNTHWRREYIYDFLLWCHNGNTQLLEAYKYQLLTEGIIENVYESILSKSGDISTTDHLLKNLRFINGEDISIKKNILNKSNIKICVLQTALKSSKSIEKFKDDLAFYFEEENEQQTMEKLFLCDEGRDVILELITPTFFENYVGPPVSCVLSDISRIRNNFLNPYSLADKIESMLSEYGHPNRELLVDDYRGLSECKMYMARTYFEYCTRQEKYRKLSEYEMSAARKLLDCNYRCVRALLRRDFTDEELYETKRRTATDTELSLDLAAQAALDIPVVL